MNHRLLLLTSALSIAGPSLIAAQPDLSKLPPPADRQGVTYEKDIRPIFEASCFGCHSRRAQRVRADLRLDTLQDVLKGSEDGKILTPGKSKDSLLVLAVSQLDDETAMPPKRAERPTGLMGRPGAFGPAMMVAGPMMTQADADHDKKLTKAEFTGLADSWFEKLDAEKAGKLNQEQFAEKFDDLLSDPGRDAAAAAPAQPDRFRGFQAGRFLGPAFFTAADADKDKSVTKSELKSTFEKWFTAWDTNKSGVLAEANLREGLNTSLPLQNPGANFGAGAELAGQMLTIGDKDKNQKLTSEEMTLVADTWFDKFDTNKTGKVSQEQFVALSTEVFPRQQGMFGGFWWRRTARWARRFCGRPRPGWSARRWPARFLKARRPEAVNVVAIDHRISADLAQAANPAEEARARISLVDPARAAVNAVEASPAILAAVQVGAQAAAPLLPAFLLRSTQTKTAR
jgi:hypothetical protein